MTEEHKDKLSETTDSKRDEPDGGGDQAAAISRLSDQGDSTVLAGSKEKQPGFTVKDDKSVPSDLSMDSDEIIDDNANTRSKKGYNAAAVEDSNDECHAEQKESNSGNDERTQRGNGDKQDADEDQPEDVQEDEEEELGDTCNFNAEERNELFACGLTREKQGKRSAALKCYLGCLSGLTKDTRFVLLPQCLRNIAEIYYQNQDYDKAIHFVQAEKLYYENALINTEEIQQKLEELNMSQGQQTSSENRESNASALETLRAEEYEHLAKLCMDKKQPQLAMEYAGKCTKLRQQVFGEHHPKTQQTLDFFASLYAEVGKQQYNDCLQTLDSDEGVDVLTESDNSAPTTPSGDCSPVSILRHRKNSEKDKKHVRFHESVVDNSNQREQEEWLSRTVVTGLLVVCCLFLAILGLGLYCRIGDARPCRSLMEGAHNAYLQMRYQYYKYTSTKHVKFA